MAKQIRNPRVRVAAVERPSRLEEHAIGALVIAAGVLALLIFVAR